MLLTGLRLVTAGRRRAGGWAVLGLLVGALATVYVFGGDWGHFRRHLPGHDRDSAKNLALAENLSPEHNFRLFLRLYPGPGGEPVYEMYSRFPIGNYALIKLAIMFFGDDLSAKLHAGRVLGLLMFAGGAVLAYQALRRIASSRLVALAATLPAFSSYYILFYNDMVSNEIIMDLFAVLLVFHGMVVFVQEGRFRQLLVKTGIAILLGWHVYALLAPFIALGLGGEIFRAFGRVRYIGAGPARVRYVAGKFLRSRYVTLGIVAGLLGLVVLGFNVVNEYTAYNGDVSLRELPSAGSILKRLGQDAEYNASQAAGLEWGRFFGGQIRRIGKMVLPYAFSVYTDGLHGLHPRGGFSLSYLWVGIVALVVCGVGLLLARRYRMLLGTLALSGVVWGVVVRHNTAFHNYESLFYIGIPLVLFTLVFWGARRWWGRPLLGAAAMAGMVVFVLSAYQMGRTDALAQDSELQAALMSDFQVISDITRGHSVYIPAAELAPVLSWRGAPNVSLLVDTGTYLTTERLLNYYFAGSVMEIENKLLYGCGADCGEIYDFAVSMERREVPALLTPGNRLVFLYDADGVSALQREQYREILSGRPAALGYFDLYLSGDRLYYYRESCVAGDGEELFFLHLYPTDPANIPAGQRQYGFDSFSFEFEERGAVVEGGCLAMAPLPGYELARIRTGQWVRGGGEIWDAEIFPGR